MLRLSRLAVAALGLFGFAISASAQTVVADLPLAGGASERVLFASPANPPAIDSSEIRSAPCQAMSPRGCLGIEPQVVGRVVGWIRAAATP
ncbi:MAG TPA: hypothetical protein VM755_04205 [Stellaceae bacterium]|nr:hypothetical protein [Stellaceae bacterium]